MKCFVPLYLWLLKYFNCEYVVLLFCFIDQVSSKSNWPQKALAELTTLSNDVVALVYCNFCQQPTLTVRINKTQTRITQIVPYRKQ